MRLIFFILFSSLVFGDDLKSLLEFAKQNNNLLNASKLSILSKEKELNSAKDSYYPTIDANTFYTRTDKPNSFMPKITYGTTLKVGFDIYDASKKCNTKKQKMEELSSVDFSYKQNLKSTSLSIVKDFYNLKTLYATLDVKTQASKVLKAQLYRVEQFYDAKMTTRDNVDKLQSEYDKNTYDIQALKFKIFSLKRLLELQVGRVINTLDNSKFKKEFIAKSLELDDIKVIKHDKKALEHLSETIDSYYYPNIRIEDSYTFYGYEDKPIFAGQTIPLLDTQNELIITLNLRLFDFGTLAEQKQSIKLKADSLNEQILYKSKEQEMQLELAFKRIKVQNLKIISAKSALKFAKNTFKTITQKYNVGIVDNVVYLDALFSYTQAKALYEKSLNDLEIAYAIYYYYNSQKLEEYL